jgi:hypothetical protein
LPARKSVGQISHSYGLAPALDHSSNTAASNNLADLHGWQIALAAVEPGSNSRIHAEVKNLDEGLTLSTIGQRLLLPCEIAISEEADRTLFQDPLSIDQRN